jgi:hypothetical protein
MGNAAEGNVVLVFDRNLRGKLSPGGTFDRGALSTGGPGV